VGDAVAGAVLQAIAADHVVLSRSEGPLTLPLRDPTRPKPAPTQTAVTPAPVPSGQATPTVSGASPSLPRPVSATDVGGPPPPGTVLIPGSGPLVPQFQRAEPEPSPVPRPRRLPPMSVRPTP
jgi:hypothetical protein